MSDQLLILGEQHHRMKRLDGEVDFIVHDSPFVMGLAYIKDDKHLPKDIFKNLITSMYSSYKNINILIKRNNTFEYQEYGRLESFDEAIAKDNEIKSLLEDNNIKYIELNNGPSLVDEIYSIVLKV